MTLTDDVGYIRRRKNEQGAVLIIVLLVLSVVVALVVNTLRVVQVEMASAQVMEQRMKGRCLLRSGLVLAESVLLADLRNDSEEDPRSDHKGEDWARFQEQASRNLPSVSTGTTEVTIVDETGKLPLHLLVDEKGELHEEYSKIFEALLSSPPFELEEEQVEIVMNSIKDWVDPDETRSGMYGAELPYYQEKGMPYGCRNASFLSLGELLLVRGITEELYYGTEKAPGLKDLVTLYGEGKVNINTAPVEVLAALIQRGESGISSDEAGDFAADMINYRSKEAHWDKLGDPQWYNEVAGALSMHLYPVVTTESSFFSAHISAQTGACSLKGFAVVERKVSEDGGERKGRIKVLTYETQ